MGRIIVTALLVSIGVLGLFRQAQPADPAGRSGGLKSGAPVVDAKIADQLKNEAKVTGEIQASQETAQTAPKEDAPTPAPEPPIAEQPDFGPLQKQIEAFVKAQPATYKVYFQDLESGVSFGIGENDWMVAASSTKVPTVLYLYTLADQGKVNLNDTVTYQDADYQSGAGSLQFSIRAGDQVSLAKLANLAIVESDNIAHRMLLRYLGKDSVASFMKSLGGQTVYPDGSNISTAKDLATYVRAALAFAEKSPQHGGKLLYDLEHTIWNAGLNGKLPAGVTVAHKEGDVTGVSNDVGVVYGSRPYLLAVMSKNQANAEAGFAYIAQISRMAYDFEEGLTS